MVKNLRIVSSPRKIVALSKQKRRTTIRRGNLISLEGLEKIAEKTDAKVREEALQLLAVGHLEVLHQADLLHKTENTLILIVQPKIGPNNQN